MPAVGKQVTAESKTAANAMFGLGTRDEAQKMHPAFAPGLNSSPEVGPGRYEAPSSLGKQVSSDHAYAGASVFTTANRFAMSTRSLTPGPVYTPKLDFKSTAYKVPNIKFGTSERKPMQISKTPAPKYNLAVDAGRLATVRHSVRRAQYVSLLT